MPFIVGYCIWVGFAWLWMPQMLSINQIKEAIKKILHKFEHFQNFLYPSPSHPSSF